MDAFQMGMPGAPELVVMLLIFLLMIVPLVAVVAVGVLLWHRSGGDDDRVAELRQEVDRLESQVADLEAELHEVRERETETAGE